MTNSASHRDRAEAQKPDSSQMQSEEALKKKKKWKNIFFSNFIEFSTSASH